MGYSFGPPPIVKNGLISCIDGSQKNASGNLIDTVSNLALTENGVTKLNTKGGEIDFDGTDDSIVQAADTRFNNIGTGPFSILFWLDIDAVSQYPGIWRLTNATNVHGPNDQRLKFQNSDTMLHFQIDGNNNVVIDDTDQSVAGSGYHHYAITRENNGNMKGYFDNDLKSTVDTSGQSLASSNSTVTIGENSHYLNGRLGQMLFYNRELTAAEVSQNYNSQRTRFGI